MKYVADWYLPIDGYWQLPIWMRPESEEIADTYHWEILVRLWDPWPLTWLLPWLLRDYVVMWLIKSINYVLQISDVHEVLFVQLFIINSNKFDYIQNLSCQLIGSHGILSSCRYGRGCRWRYLSSLPSIIGISSLPGTTNVVILHMIPMKSWEKATNTNKNRFLLKVSFGRIYGREFNP